nr:MAG TPA: hypothetical protein [Caudoviricetes sp.]
MSILWRIKCKPSRYCCLLGFFFFMLAGTFAATGAKQNRV